MMHGLRSEDRLDQSKTFHFPRHVEVLCCIGGVFWVIILLLDEVRPSYCHVGEEYTHPRGIVGFFFL